MARELGEQRRRIEPIGLGLSRAARDLDARRIDDETGDAERGQRAVQPEAIAARFVATHDGRVERNLWLERDWFQPDYAGRPWTLWTANAALRTAAGPEPVQWVVIQP